MTYQKVMITAVAALAVLACSQLPPPAAAPAGAGAAAVADAGPQLQIDSAHSLIVATVRRGGVLARSATTTWWPATPSAAASRRKPIAPISRSVDEMKIDEADLRRIAGLEKQPSADAIEGTRHNMLTKVLDAGAIRWCRCTPNAVRRASRCKYRSRCTA
jgi:hypothetical protein